MGQLLAQGAQTRVDHGVAKNRTVCLKRRNGGLELFDLNLQIRHPALSVILLGQGEILVLTAVSVKQSRRKGDWTREKRGWNFSCAPFTIEPCSRWERQISRYRIEHEPREWIVVITCPNISRLRSISRSISPARWAMPNGRFQNTRRYAGTNWCDSATYSATSQTPPRADHAYYKLRRRLSTAEQFQDDLSIEPACRCARLVHGDEPQCAF